VRTRLKQVLVGGLAALWLSGLALAATPSPEVLARVQAKLDGLRWLSTDATVVAAVREYNANPSAQAQGMTNDTWKGLTVLDPFARSLAKSPLMGYLKGKKGDSMSELFISGADGGKVGFFSKTSSWTHKGKDKHEQPMKGQEWIGPLEVDKSTGVEQVQVGLPVLDGGKPIGSVVVGLAVAKLK